MSARYWREVDGVLAGVDGPCDAARCHERTRIFAHARPHAHVVLDTDDGTAWIPFPFESLEGLKALLACLKARGDTDFNDIVIAAIVDETKRLGFPEPMTEEEADWLASPKLMETLTSYGYVLMGR